MKKISLILLILFSMGFSIYAVDYPGKAPGTSVLTINSATISLQNNVLKQTWTIVNNKIIPAKLTDIQGKTSIDLSAAELFNVIVDGKLLKSSELIMQRSEERRVGKECRL